ncbi:MAG: hypothetical protein PHX78_01350 [bacterium]|nr:hypothetical protein [bacterium]
MKIKIFFLGLIAFVSAFSGAVLASDPAAKADPNLPKIIGSRVLGLGGAFTAIANDANAVFINPAGILQIKGGFLDMGYNAASDKNFYSAHMGFANSSPAENEAAGLGFYTKGNNIDQVKDRQHIILISLAQAYTKNFYFGGNAKYIKNTSENEIDITSTKESAFSFDIGMLFTLNEFVSLGVMGYDLGKPDISTNPRKVTAGLGLNFTPVMNIGFDVDHFAQKGISQRDYHAGIDFLPQQSMSVQLGYYTDKLNNTEAITGGFRLQLKQKDRNDYIGYAYSEELREGSDGKIEKLHSVAIGLFY